MGLCCAQEAGAVPEPKPDKEIVGFSSPPLREDDKDGRYVFAVGENLTSRCNYTFKFVTHSFFIYLSVILACSKIMA